MWKFIKKRPKYIKKDIVYKRDWMWNYKFETFFIAGNEIQLKFDVITLKVISPLWWNYTFMAYFY